MTFHLRPLALEPNFEFDDSQSLVLYDSAKAQMDQTTEVEVGAPISFSAKVNNVGQGEGVATVWLQKRVGYTWIVGAEENLMSGSASIPAGQSKTITPTSGSYNMPDEDVYLRLWVGLGSTEHDTTGHRNLRSKLRRAWRRIRR